MMKYYAAVLVVAIAFYSIAKIYFFPSNESKIEYNEISENEFISIVKYYKDQYKNANNGMGEGAARLHRRYDICSRENTLEIKNWTGKISYLSSTEKSKGILTINISPEISLSTKSTEFSDNEENPTLISEESPFYESLSKMKEGDNVIFSGKFISDIDDCFKENSITMTGGMLNPEFLFHFDDVVILKDNKIEKQSKIKDIKKYRNNLSKKDIEYVHSVIFDKIKSDGIYGLSKFIDKCYLNYKDEKSKNICILEDLSAQVIDKDTRDEFYSKTKSVLPPVEFFSKEEVSKRFEKYILPEFHSYEKLNEFYSKPILCVINEECKN